MIKLIYKAVRKVQKLFIFIFAPSYCVFCHIFTKHNIFLCDNCADLIIPLATKEFFITQKYQATVFAVSDYQDPLRLLTLGKYYKNRVASIQLAELIWSRTDLCYQDFDYIVPIPLHWTRYAWRWYNQSEIMAETLSKKSGKPVIHLLKRTRRTIFQTGLSYAQRTENLKDAFSLIDGDLSLYRGKKILVVDDVLTTGTTLYEAGKCLIKLVPDRLIFAVACRVGNR
jgi:ComF family protein